MRTYYIFKIKKYYCYIYKNNPYKLYKIIEDLYKNDAYNIDYWYKYYHTFAIEFNKSEINNYLYLLNKNNIYYLKKDNYHYINNATKDQILINKNCLILKTKDIYSLFLNDLNQYINDIFICDFKNKDYFWLELLLKDRQKKHILV